MKLTNRFSYLVLVPFLGVTLLLTACGSSTPSAQTSTASSNQKTLPNGQPNPNYNPNGNFNGGNVYPISQNTPNSNNIMSGYGSGNYFGNGSTGGGGNAASLAASYGLTATGQTYQGAPVYADQSGNYYLYQNGSFQGPY
jgi:hypothetical protein